MTRVRHAVYFYVVLIFLTYFNGLICIWFMRVNVRLCCFIFTKCDCSFSIHLTNYKRRLLKCLLSCTVKWIILYICHNLEKMISCCVNYPPVCRVSSSMNTYILNYHLHFNFLFFCLRVLVSQNLVLISSVFLLLDNVMFSKIFWWSIYLSRFERFRIGCYDGNSDFRVCWLSIFLQTEDGPLPIVHFEYTHGKCELRI